MLQDDGPLSEERTRSIGIQVCKSLAEAHANGVVHRDLKPANIMLFDLPGEPDVGKVVDFGISKALGGSESFETAVGSVLGTPYYMSPEQAAGAGRVDARADLYALGIILSDCVGTPPDYEADTVLRIDTGVWITNLTSDGTTATSAGAMALGDVRRLPRNGQIQVGEYRLHCSVAYPTSDFTAPIDASRLDLPIVLEVPRGWKDGAAKIGGAPVALTSRTHAVLRCLASSPNTCVSASTLSVAIGSDGGGDPARAVRTLRAQMTAALADLAARETLSVALSSPETDAASLVARLVATRRGAGFQLNLAPALITIR